MLLDDSKTDLFSASLLEFLVRGIGTDCQPFRECCVEVLHSMGSLVADDLRDIAQHARLTPRHKKRLTAMILSLDESDDTSANPIPSMFKALLLMVAAALDEDESIRAVGMVSDFVGKHLVASILMDELCDHSHDRRYATRLINALATVRDSLSETHREYLGQIIRYSPSNDVSSRCGRLLTLIDDRDRDEVTSNNGSHDPVIKGLKLLGWLTRDAVIGPDTAVRDPEWIWLRDFRYQPTIVNFGPMLTGSGVVTS